MDPTDLDEQHQPTTSHSTLGDPPRRDTGPRGDRGQGHGRGGRESREQRRAEVARLRAVGRNLGTQIEEQVHQRPFIALGAMAGVGFVAGSLFGSRFGQMVLAVAVGYAAKNIFGGDLGVERLRSSLEKLTGDVGVR